MRVDTPIGPVHFAASDVGLTDVHFGGPGFAQDGPTAVLDEVREQLVDYFAGRRHRFDLAVDWAVVSGFQLDVLRALDREVGFGESITYGELAALAGQPDGSRAVGVAMATNPIPIVLPCHRVLASGGALGGFGGGLEMKRWLLTHEGQLPPTLFPIDVPGRDTP
ncbi:methylated-DNA-[protein]-cysteine S-methyltransferase [Tamaricihabitans halophyticus]|uniref:Methylated-DNA--protein-cysteine methyltransferase n=1 Tax=Tamaricihabitans halophyticus TaxID=1262583 RepID=A0A4R2R935_9PSEU|nr:methylated-DNA--[protein]-cysteine S-methyltransferase [Tamaricihabitans halophyticus]TCP56171.1 methylated-DNA-[protein]-cysteine S-methyltransferase [Tamaricihabitans halophyticus]